MNNNEFYRFGEKHLSRIANTNDLYSFVEEDNLSIFVKLCDVPSLLTVRDDPSKGIGTGIIDGYATLHSKDALKLLRHETVKVETVNVLGVSIKSFANKYPFSSNLPLPPLKTWSPKEINHLHSTLLNALLNPIDQDTPHALLQQGLQSLIPGFKDIKTEQMTANEYFDQFAKRHINTAPVRLKLVDILIDTEQLRSALAARQAANSIDRSRLKTASVRSSPIYLDVFNYLKSHPHVKTAEIWEALMEEHELGGMPTIDIQGSIDAISDNGLRYFDDNGKTEDIKKKTFQNEVTKMKKLL